MRVALLGAGLQAQAACFDLTRQPDLTEILVADSDLGRAEALARTWKDERIRPVHLDASDEAAAERLLKGTAAALSCVPYRFNASLARAAVRAGSSFCDLGGNNTVVAAELALHDQAQAAGVTVVPDCGLAPGMVAVLAADAVASLDTVESLSIRVGGLPQKPGGLLDYSLVFNIEGLINEYVEDAVVLRDGQPVIIPSLDHFESLSFPEPFGSLEAFTTSGGTSTLPQTYRGRINQLDYKTIRYPGHAIIFQTMHRLGLLSSDPVQVGDVKLAPRALFATVAAPRLDRGEPDVVLMRTVAVGTRGGKPVTRSYQMIEYPDVEHGLTAMMRTTAFPATIVLLMLARNEVKAKGALPQELCIDPVRFREELAAPHRHINVELREE